MYLCSDIVQALMSEGLQNLKYMDTYVNTLILRNRLRKPQYLCCIPRMTDHESILK